MTSDIEAEFWRSIALAVLSVAPPSLQRTIIELGTVPETESLRRLREFSDETGNRLHADAANQIYRDSYWRN